MNGTRRKQGETYQEIYICRDWEDDEKEELKKMKISNVKQFLLNDEKKRKNKNN